MRFSPLWILLGLFFSGCGNHEASHDHPHPHEEAPAELRTFAVTQWTERTELFAEHRALVAGRETAFAVHLTDLKDFSALASGNVALIFKDNEGEQIFTAETPTSPGIFRPVAKLLRAGTYDLTLSISGPFEDKHIMPRVEVYSSFDSAPKEGHEEAPEDIVFLKEQQWKMDFDVEPVVEKELFDTLMVPGQIRLPLKPAMLVLAPAGGELVESSQGFPLLGSFVTQGQVLAAVRSQEQTIPIVSPISGVVSVVHAALGDSVEAGRKLFDLMDTQRVWVEARVYEPDVPKLNNSITALIEIPGIPNLLENRRLVSIGGTLDTVSRTVPVVFEVGNENSILKLGSTVKLHIRTQKGLKTPVIPLSALIDEDGKRVAYVQIEGEAFQKRELKLGIREGLFVQVLEGVQVGERVVTEGAYSIRLMSVSSEIPAHGHAH